MKKFDINEDPHRRYNPLINEWVLVSPHRSKRPWQGQNETVSSNSLPEYDATCYLCPGNVRANGEINPAYENSFVFENDFAALKQEEISFEKCNESVIGKTLAELHLFESGGINVLGMKTADGQYVINPPASTKVTRQMKLFVLGTTSQVEAFLSKLTC